MSQKFENNIPALSQTFRHVTKVAAMMVGVLRFAFTFAEIIIHKQITYNFNIMHDFFLSGWNR